MKDPIIRPARLAHIVIKTAKCSEFIAWCQLVLDAEAIHSDRMATFMRSKNI